MVISHCRIATSFESSPCLLLHTISRNCAEVMALRRSKGNAFRTNQISGVPKTHATFTSVTSWLLVLILMMCVEFMHFSLWILYLNSNMFFFPAKNQPKLFMIQSKFDHWCGSSILWDFFGRKIYKDMGFYAWWGNLGFVSIYSNLTSCDS